MTQPLAVVIGDMDLVRPLGLANIPVVAAGPTGTETRWSRHTCGGIDLPDLWTEPEGTVQALIAFAERQLSRPVLFYQKDPALLTISRYRDVLSDHYHFVVPDSDLVENLVDKNRFRDLAEHHDLPVPPTVIVTGGTTDSDLESLRYPLIAKPALRDQWENAWFKIADGAKAQRIDNDEQLQSLLQHPLMAETVLVLQELITGPEREIWSYHCFIDDQRTIRGEFTGRKIRTRPITYGQSTAVEVVSSPPVAEIGRRILKAVDFTGVAKVDFKRGPDGKFYLLEVNPRFSLWHHPGAAAGVNIPELVYRQLLGHSSSNAQQARPGVTWCQAWNDISAANEHGLARGRWLRFALGANTRRALHLDDPGAALGALRHQVMRRSKF